MKKNKPNDQRTAIPTALTVAAAFMALTCAASAQVSPPTAPENFADAVIRYDPLFGGGTIPNLEFRDATKALGVPDNTFVSLGRFGLVELAFTNNLLANSGTSAADVFIFEIGADVEGTLVAVRPTAATALLLGPGFDANSDGFYEVGAVAGSLSSINIDATFTGFLPGLLTFDAVQLIDRDGEFGISQGTHGADIDAVGAIFSSPIPEPASLLLLVGGGIIIAGRRRRA